MEIPYCLTQNFIQNGSVLWKKLKNAKIDYDKTTYNKINDSLLDFLKEKEKIIDFPTEDAIILFKLDDFDVNPFHNKNEAHWYFTEKGIEEARNYVKDFLDSQDKGVRILKEREIIK